MTPAAAVEPSPEPTGYLHPLYAESLAAGAVRALPRSGGHIVVRPTPALGLRDAAGPYPLLCCRHWERLGDDLADAAEGLVSLVAVADPFGTFDEPLLAACFPDLLRVFKHHQVADLSRPPESFVSAHHQRNARRAAETLGFERVAEPVSALDDWDRLYRQLIDRHRIRGAAAFTREAFAGQLRVPGLVAFRALHQRTTVGMLLFFIQGAVAYYHLGAHSDDGYERRASFGLFWHALGSLAGMGVRWLDLGAGAGSSEEPGDGLGRFKRGWATGTRPAYLCGRVFDREAYSRLVAATGADAAAYFPAYRSADA